MYRLAKHIYMHIIFFCYQNYLARAQMCLIFFLILRVDFNRDDNVFFFPFFFRSSLCVHCLHSTLASLVPSLLHSSG